MPDILKQTFDIKTVVMIVIYITGLVANNIKHEYSAKIAAKEQEAVYERKFTDIISRMNKMDSDIDKRDVLQERDIADLKSQQAVFLMTDKAQGFLLDNIQKT